LKEPEGLIRQDRQGDVDGALVMPSCSRFTDANTMVLSLTEVLSRLFRRDDLDRRGARLARQLDSGMARKV
jgi:hypothetical protein